MKMVKSGNSVLGDMGGTVRRNAISKTLRILSRCKSDTAPKDEQERIFSGKVRRISRIHGKKGRPKEVQFRVFHRSIL